MKKTWSILFIILGIILIALAIYYWVTPAGSLPHFFPGYTAGSKHTHLKHGLAALILGVGSLIVAWFMSGGSKKATLPEGTEKK